MQIFSDHAERKQWLSILPGGCTSLIQPLDVSFNRPFKTAAERLATSHMQENLDAYVQGEINAGSRRVLFTTWVGAAWEEVSRNQEMVVRSFEKVGITVPIDGSGDHNINIHGLENYSVEESSSEDEDPFADSDEEEGEYTDKEPFSDSDEVTEEEEYEEGNSDTDDTQ